MDCKKTKFSSEAFALLDLERIKKRPPREKTPIAVYLCKCGSWHLTSQPNKDLIIADQKIVIDKLIKEKQILESKNITLELKVGALETSIRKAEHKTVSSDPRIIALNKGLRKAKDLIRTLRKSNSRLINENIQYQRKK